MPDPLVESQLNGTMQFQVNKTIDDVSTNPSSNDSFLYFTPNEVARHNLRSDCYVSFFGYVYNLTSLIDNSHLSPLALPILQFAGTDITHWFDKETKQPKTRIDPQTGLSTYVIPHGRYIHLPPPLPTTDWDSSCIIEWWNDTSLRVGRLSSKSIFITIVNTLSDQSDTFEVASEDTVGRIRDRYLQFNRHARSYTFKRVGKELNLDQTLAENGIPDDSDEMVELGMNPMDYIPVIHIYFNDDLSTDE